MPMPMVGFSVIGCTTPRAALQVAAQLNPDTDAELGLPDMVGAYHSIYPLEDTAAAAEHVSAALHVSTLLVKGILTADGAPYTLRRIDPRKVTPTRRPTTHACIWAAALGMLRSLLARKRPRSLFPAP